MCAAQVLEELKRFENYRPQVVPKQLCIGNIAWDLEENDVVLKFLELKGITKLEVAPTKILDSWHDCDTRVFSRKNKKQVERFPSRQSCNLCYSILLARTVQFPVKQGSATDSLQASL